MAINPFATFLVSGLVFGGLVLPVNAKTIANPVVKKIVYRASAKAITPKATPKPVAKVPRKLDGVMVDPKEANKWPIAVMIDEHTAARPQSGLSKASVVYESLAEGGIPRFMAIFATTTNLGVVGPVRSARPYFVRYAAEYNAAMVNAGGSPDALNIMKSLKLVNLAGTKGPYAKYFYRAYGGGVHGLYTNGTKLAAAMTQAKHNKAGSFPAWKFVNDTPTSRRPLGVHGANIDLGYGQSYKIKYVYDRKQNAYLRTTGYYKQTDRQTGKQIAVKNIILLTVPKEIVLDRKGRLDLHTLGVDKGVLLQNGKAIPITWKKMSNKARTIFKDSKGREISLVRGNTWITVVPRGHKYTLF